MTYLRPGERQLQRGCCLLGFYRPPAKPTAQPFSIFGKSDRHQGPRTSSFLTFFLVVAKGKVYIEMSRVRHHFPAVDIGSLRCLSLSLGLAPPRSRGWNPPSGRRGPGPQADGAWPSGGARPWGQSTAHPAARRREQKIKILWEL